MNLEKILEVVKLKHKDAYIENETIKSEYDFSFKINTSDNSIMIYESGGRYFCDCCKNIIELKNYLNIETDWKDIKDHVAEYIENHKELAKFIEIHKDYINILIKDNRDNDVILQCNNKFNVEYMFILKNMTFYSILYKNITSFQLHQQITLKMENIINNLNNK